MQPVAADGGPALVGVTIGSTDLHRQGQVYAAITGVEPVPAIGSLAPATAAASAAGPAADAAMAFVLGDARVELLASASGGLQQLHIRVDSLDAAARRLQAGGAAFVHRQGCIVVDRAWSALQLVLVDASAAPCAAAPSAHGATAPAAAMLDHVAVLVADVPAMARRWAMMLGIEPDHMGVHPLGTSYAARFLLGGRMIELISPLVGQVPALHERLRRVGDGPFALALIAADTEATRAAVAATGARVLHQPPHWIVHPLDAAGVPVQITPRVHH